MKIWNNMANMGVLNVYHPDIYDFINAKSTNADVLNYFNLSIMMDDKFMEAVIDNKNIHLHYPVYDEKFRIIEDKSKWTFSKEVNATELWNLIMRKAYDNGEPGVLFYDNLNNDNNTWYTETIIGTNPCFSGDMRLLTVDGYKRFDELEGKEVDIVNKDGIISKNVPVWCSGQKKTITLYLENDVKIECTPDHLFMLENGESCEAINLYEKNIKRFGNESTVKVIDMVEDYKLQKVYDFTEPLTHWGVVEGVIAHNCGEYIGGVIFDQELPSEEYGGACNLGSLYLHNFVSDPFLKTATIDWNLLSSTIHTAVRMLDNVIDINVYPIKHYENYQKGLRTIGLGVTGLADMLAMMGYRYDKADGREFVDNLMEFVVSTAYNASIGLAIEKGSFPMLDREKFVRSDFIRKHANNLQWEWVESLILSDGIRNARLISVAPVGTLSLTFGNNCSSGIEPIFNLSYDRKIKLGGQEESNTKNVVMEDYAYGLYNELKANNVDVISDDVFVTALNIDVEDHIKMLATIAKHVDMSVSKTINIPEDYPFEKTKDVYIDCWESGIKGCTIFRPNALRPGILTTSASDTHHAVTTQQELPRGFIYKVNDDLIGNKRKITNGCGKFHLQLFFDEVTGEPYETFIDMGDGGGCERNLEFESKLMSTALRGGIPIEAIIDVAKSVRPCKSYCDRTKSKGDTSKGTSCPNAIGWALEDLYDKIQERCFADYEEESEEEPIEIKDKNHCPECGDKLASEGGCPTCKTCGWNKCS